MSVASAVAPVSSSADARSPRTLGVLTLTCSEHRGIVQAVTSFLLAHGLDIVEHHQFDDNDRGALFLRTAFATDGGVDVDGLTAAFAPIAERFAMTFSFHDERTPRLLVMVSKLGHCLNDLHLPVAGRHPGRRHRPGGVQPRRPAADGEAAGLPFLHLPVTARHQGRGGGAAADPGRGARRRPRRAGPLHADPVRRPVPGAHGRAINIHHSFLPGFKGAKSLPPGVRPGGEAGRGDRALRDRRPGRGPDHRAGGDPGRPHLPPARSLATVGQDAECLALSRAVRWHCENRVLLHGPAPSSSADPLPVSPAQQQE